MLTAVLLFINPNLQKQKRFHTPSRSGLGEGKKKAATVIKWDPRARKRPGSALVMQRLKWEEGGETRWDLRHCWHNTADYQQNGLLEGDERLPRLACSQTPAKLAAVAQLQSSIAASRARPARSTTTPPHGEGR